MSIYYPDPQQSFEFAGAFGGFEFNEDNNRSVL